MKRYRTQNPYTTGVENGIGYLEHKTFELLVSEVEKLIKKQARILAKQIMADFDLTITARQSTDLTNFEIITSELRKKSK